MAGKRVLITGAGTGIGKGVALEFAKERATVALHYTHDGEPIQESLAAIQAVGGKPIALQADFRDLTQARKMVSDALDFLGGIDVLVNNAGITMNKPFLEVTEEQFDTLYDVNVRGMFFITQAVVPAMLAQGKGAIVNLASVHAFAGMTEHTVYAGTKAAIAAFTRVLALELAPKGVRVNAIAPGWILVENHLKVLNDFDVDAAGHNIPAGFVGRPQDIGRLAIFLASDEARYIVGQTVVCDGGQLAIMPNSGDFHDRRQEQWGQGYVPGV
jgi:NAD(P)-dependent dehydrogenase (short-subunit alcohol dehydrogenase family)